MVGSLSLNAYSYSNIISGASGKLYVPVTPNAVIYSQFDHISGVPSSDSTRGISVSKIQILNSLLNQLITMRNQPAQKEYTEQDGLNQNQMESLIQKYQSQIQFEMKKAEATGYGLAGAMPETGNIVNIQL